MLFELLLILITLAFIWLFFPIGDNVESIQEPKRVKLVREQQPVRWLYKIYTNQYGGTSKTETMEPYQKCSYSDNKVSELNPDGKMRPCNAVDQLKRPSGNSYYTWKDDDPRWGEFVCNYHKRLIDEHSSTY